MRWVGLILFLGLSNVTLFAQTNTTSVLPVDVTIAIGKGINYLRAQAAKSEDGWLFPSLEGNKIVGWKTNEVHYREVEVNVPGYRYETYEVIVPGNSPTDPMRREARRRIVGLDPSQDHKEKRLQLDPGGPIVKRNIPIYEKETALQWAYGAIGNNAMAVVALRRCGVRGDDPLVAQPVSGLGRLVNTYGLPDNLYDLAWLTAAFALTPGDAYQDLTGQCAAKLLDAQITSGPGAGLWGPVAVNPAMLSAFLRVLARWGEERKDLATDLVAEQKKIGKGKPTAKLQRLEDDIKKLDARVAALQDESGRISQLGFMMFDVFGVRTYGRVKLVHQAEFITIESLPYLIQNQESVDLESTALALLALRVAFENNRLPEKAWRPSLPKALVVPGVATPPLDFPPARTVAEVVGLTGKAVASARTPAGQWTELNFHQPVTALDWLKSIPQVKPELFPKLAQPVTFASICRGVSVAGSGGKGTILEGETCRGLVEDLANRKMTLVGTNDVRQVYDVLPLLASPRNGRGKVARTDFAVWNDLADWLMQRQVSTNGAWGRESARVIMPSSSLMQLKQVIPTIVPEPAPAGNTITKNYDKPHLSPGFYMAPNFVFWFGAPEANYFTTTALYFLADGLPGDWVPESKLTISGVSR